MAYHNKLKLLLIAIAKHLLSFITLLTVCVLSLRYSLPNLKFGKVDVGKYPAVAKKYHINDTSLSVQLPTIALYQDGKLLMRRPTVDSQKRLQKFFFTEVGSSDLFIILVKAERFLIKKKLNF